MSKAFSRSRRVGEQIQRNLSELIRREIRDPRLGPVTIVDVQVSDDLSHAKVFYSILGGDKQPDLTRDIMHDAARALRGPLGRSLGLRHSPQLTFVADELLQYGAHMTQVINEAVKRDQTRHADDAEKDRAKNKN